jgi:single-stranded-DNA-specific exonuclease
LPPSLKGLDTAVELIDQAIDQQQKIVIIGDYDADGATSTALMILVLKEMGANVEYLVPDRFKYGYGLTLKLLNWQSKAISQIF